MKSLYAPLGLHQLEAKWTAFVNYEPQLNALIADISDELKTLESEIGTINEAARPHELLKLSIFYRAVRKLDKQYDPIILQLSLTNITDFEAIVAQLMEYERKLSANDKTIKEMSSALRQIVEETAIRRDQQMSMANGPEKRTFVANAIIAVKQGTAKRTVGQNKKSTKESRQQAL